MADWVTISSLATAGGTLVLACTTYASVRSANRASRVAEASLLGSLRPLLFPSRPDDPPQRAGFGDGVALVVPGGGAAAEVVDGRLYLALSVRNVGTGYEGAGKRPQPTLPDRQRPGPGRRALPE